MTLTIVLFLGVANLAPDAASVYKKCSSSVYQISTPTKLGSGFSVNSGRLVVTSFHVVKDGGKILINGSVGAKVVSYSAEHDLALLLPDRKLTSGLTLATKDVAVGSKVLVISHPLGLQKSLSEGLVSGHRTTGGVKLIQLTAAVSQGSSGGPVLTQTGQVAGIIMGSIESGQSLNFAIKSSELRKLPHANAWLTLNDTSFKVNVKEIAKPTATKVSAVTKSKSKLKPLPAALLRSLNLAMADSFDPTTQKAQKVISEHVPSLLPYVVERLASSASGGYILLDFGDAGIKAGNELVRIGNSSQRAGALKALRVATSISTSSDRYPFLKSEAFRNTLAALLKSSDTSELVAAINMCGDLDALTNHSRIVELAHHKDSDVSWEAVCVAARWATNSKHSEELQSALRTIESRSRSENEDGGRLAWAIAAVGISDNVYLGAVILPYIDSREARVREKAAEALGALKYRDAYFALQPLKVDTDPLVRQAAYCARAKLNPVESMDEIVALYKSRLLQDRHIAAVAFEFTKNSGCIAFLEALANEQSEGYVTSDFLALQLIMRKAAIRSLVTFDDSAVEKALEGLLQDPLPEIRQSARVMLKEWKERTKRREPPFPLLAATLK